MTAPRELNDLTGGALKPNTWIADTSQRRAFTTAITRPPETYAGVALAVNDIWTAYTEPVVQLPQQTQVRVSLIVATNSGLWTTAAAANEGEPNNSQASLYDLAYRRYGSGGTGPDVKFYDGGSGIATAWNNLLSSGYGSKVNETKCTLCWKGAFNQASFLSTCRAARTKFPDEKLKIIYEQESDRNGGPTVANVQTAIAQMYSTIQSDPNLAGNTEIWLSLTAYNQYETPRAGKQFEDFVPNSSVASQLTGVSYDVYQFQSSNYNPNYDPAPIFQDMLTRCSAQGLALHIGEFGVTDLSYIGKPDSDALRAGRFNKAVAFINAHPYDQATGLGCLGLSYYENYAGVNGQTTTGAIGLLRDYQIYPLTFAAVKNAIWPGP